MATYKEIIAWIKEEYGFVAQSCWIAHMKELNGLNLKQASNRQCSTRKKPCPIDKQDKINNAFKHFGMI